MHEVLHRFYGPHNAAMPYSVNGIMDPATTVTGTIAQNELAPRQIRYIQYNEDNQFDHPH